MYKTVAFLFACVIASAVLAEPPAKVSPSDQVQFQQKTIEGQMQELQERMYRLADLTREAEPDDSARLLMAVRKAREDLIIEQMRLAVEELGRVDLTRATEEQEEILRKLAELKKLLTTTDLDLQMQLDKLHKLNDAIAKLDKGIIEEKRQQTASAETAQKSAEAPKNPAAVKDQKQNRQATEAVAQTVKDLGPGPAKAAETLGKATAGMSVAEGELTQSHPGPAAELQGKATEDMKAARAQLEEERQKLLDDLDKQVRQQVVANLQEMLDREKSIRGASEAVVTRGNPGDRQVQMRVKQLGPAQVAVSRICAATRELIEQTQFSIALPPALQEIEERSNSVADKLAGGAIDMAVVDDQKRIEQDLQNLLDTFKELASAPSESKGKKKNGRSPKNDQNKLLAELKTLRVLEARVNARTEQTDQAAAKVTGAMPEPLRRQIENVRDQQEQVHSAMRKLQEELESQG